MPYLALLFLIVGLGASLRLVSQRQVAPKASVDLVDLTVSAPASVDPDQQFTATIGVDPHNYKVTTIDLIVNVSPNLQLLSIQPGAYLGTVLTAATISGNTAHIILGNGTTPAQGAGLLAIINLKAHADASGTAQITIDSSTVVAGIDSNGHAVPTTILGDVGLADININTTPAPQSFWQNILNLLLGLFRIKR